MQYQYGYVQLCIHGYRSACPSRQSLRLSSRLLVLSGLAFGLFHGNLVQAVYATVIGCLLALVYEWYGTIAAPMLFHSVANLFVYVMLELLPFGGVFLSVPSCVLFLVLSAGSLFLLWMLQGKAASRQKG